MTISIRDALELLATAIRHCDQRMGGEADRPHDLVRYALSLAPVDADDLAALGRQCVRDAYANGGLREQMTLGALVVFDAAERSQRRGRSGSDLFDDALRAAGCYADLVPDSTLAWWEIAGRFAGQPDCSDGGSLVAGLDAGRVSVAAVVGDRDGQQAATDRLRRFWRRAVVGETPIR